MSASRSLRSFAAQSVLQERPHPQEPVTESVSLVRGLLARAGPSLLVLAGYLLLSAALFGRVALAHLHTVVVGFGPQPAFDGRDQSAFVWYLDWGAHAIARLHNPLATTAIFAPYGYNLAWATSIQGPALVMSPVTLLFGEIVAFNLLALAAPATAAWTAYLLCRQLAPSRRSSAIAGGLLFGFGTYETVEMINHINLALVALLPLAALLAVSRATARISSWRYVVCLALLLTAELWTSTEVLASMTIFGVIALLLATLFARGERRRAIVATARDTVIALPLAAILGSPFLYHAIRYSNPVQSLSNATDGANIVNFLSPSTATWLPALGRVRANTTAGGNLTEELAYLGIPLVAVLLAFAISFRRTFAGRLLTWFIVVALILTLGAHLIDGGQPTSFALPWSVLESLPLMHLMMPGRFVVYVWVAIAVVVAMWLDRPTRRPVRWGLLALVIVSLIPNVSKPWATHVDAPPLMRSSQLARYLPVGSTALALPFGIDGNSMYWQAQAGFSFNLAGGYSSVELPKGYLPDRHLIEAFTGMPYAGDATPNLCDFLHRTSTTTILLREHTRGPWARLLDPLHIDPIRVGGFYVYPLASALAPGGVCARR